jgi:tripartite-type tricarboxylate transporter receptor subunit TctC
MMPMRYRLATLAAALAALGALAAPAAAFPDRALTLVVPFAAGGPTDKLARELAVSFGRSLGGAVVVENVGGAGGTLGVSRVARARPDGHTLLLYHIGMATSPSLYPKLPYDTLADFVYLGMVNEVPMVLVGRRTLPASDFAALARWLRDPRRRAVLADAGPGAASQLCGLLLQQSLGVPLATVSYKGTAPAMADLLAGHVDILCDQTTNTAEQIAAGTVRAFGVTTPQPLRAPALAGLPTLQAQGLVRFDISIWHGLYAPRGTPAAVVQALNAALRSALRDPAFVDRMQALGAEVVDDDRLTPEGHRRFVAAEIERWGRALRAAAR